MATESQEQIYLFRRAAMHPITKNYMWSHQTGSIRNPHYGGQLVSMGMKKGIPDVILAYPIEPYHGLWIELKHAAPRKGILSGDQVIILERLKVVGYDTHVAYGWVDAWNKICDYLKLEKDQYTK